MTEPLFLLDSNIAIYVLADSNSTSAVRVQSMPLGSVVTSSIAYAEVMRGFASEDEATRALASRLFDVIAVMPFDTAAAEVYATLPFRRGSFDRLIAAHALACGLVLITNNERDFADIPGLKVENWTLPL